MKLKLKWVKNTKNYACYETENVDFRFPYQIVMKLWIPFQEIQTDVPGQYPEFIEVRIMDDSGSVEITPSHPDTGVPWN